MISVQMLRLLLLACLIGMAAPAAADQRLREAAARSDVALVERLLGERVDAGAADAESSGAAVNAAEPQLGHTALMWAARLDHADIVQSRTWSITSSCC